MTDSITSALYYPDMMPDNTTLKKAILLFDEIHFIDRPSFTLKNYGTIGAPSPLREVEESFRDDAKIPLYVHGIVGNKLPSDILEQIEQDIQDADFLKNFQDGLRNSVRFQNINIPPGNYGPAGNANDVLLKMTSFDVDQKIRQYGNPIELLYDEKIKPFNFSADFGPLKQLILSAATFSANLNFALKESVRHGMTPFADAKPYTNILKTRFHRAMHNSDLDKSIPITDLSLAIFDRLLPTKSIQNLDMHEVVKYRHKFNMQRRELMDQMDSLRLKQSLIAEDDDYEIAINKIITQEVLPAVKKYRDELKTINDGFFAELAEDLLNWIGGGAGLSLFVDLNWNQILNLGLAASANIAKKAIKGILSERKVKRECSFSYILSLD